MRMDGDVEEKTSLVATKPGEDKEKEETTKSHCKLDRVKE